MDRSKKRKQLLCVIPARYRASRLPGKPLKMINGLPLVMWVYNRALESGVFDGVYVATDEKRIQDTVNSYNGESIMTSSAHQSGTDRIYEALRGKSYGYVVNLQCDEPLIPIDIIKDFTEALLEIDDLSLITCVSNATIKDMENPNVVKAVLDANGYALYFSRSPIPYIRDDKECELYKHNGIYGFTRESLDKFYNYPPGKLEKIEKLEQLRALEMGMKIRCLFRNYISFGIDTQEDLDMFRKYVRNRNINVER